MYEHDICERCVINNFGKLFKVGILPTIIVRRLRKTRTTNAKTAVHLILTISLCFFFGAINRHSNSLTNSLASSKLS